MFLLKDAVTLQLMNIDDLKFLLYFAGAKTSFMVGLPDSNCSRHSLTWLENRFISLTNRQNISIGLILHLHQNNCAKLTGQDLSI